MIQSDLILLDLLPPAPTNGDRPQHHDSSIIRRRAHYAGLNLAEVDDRLRHLVGDGYATLRTVGHRRLFCRTPLGNETVDKAKANGVMP